MTNNNRRAQWETGGDAERTLDGSRHIPSRALLGRLAIAAILCRDPKIFGLGIERDAGSVGGTVVQLAHTRIQHDGIFGVVEVGFAIGL